MRKLTPEEHDELVAYLWETLVIAIDKGYVNFSKYPYFKKVDETLTEFLVDELLEADL
jgi:hypothetical protein